MIFSIASAALFHNLAASLMKVEHSTLVISGSKSDSEFDDLVFMFDLSFLISHLVGCLGAPNEIIISNSEMI